MLIGIIETGTPPGKLHQPYGSYPTMLQQMLSTNSDATPAFRYSHFSVHAPLPSEAALCDGWLITGSSSGAYEKHPWIEPLHRLIRSALTEAIPIVGICFGHQIMAQALGGKVISSEKGWGLGLNQYDIKLRHDWMKHSNDHIILPASHQDQVITPPAEAKVLASSAFCPYAALSYDNIGLSFQGHPEFQLDFLTALIESRRNMLAAPIIHHALDSVKKLEKENSASTVAQWIKQFFIQPR